MLGRNLTQRVTGFRFGALSDSQIIAQSVRPLWNPDTFDELGHAQEFGLHDPALGAIDDEVCVTCGLSTLHCPGHMGHIPLPLAVYNPPLFRTLLDILHVSCLHCHSLLAHPLAALLLRCQLYALSGGHLELYFELEQHSDMLYRNLTRTPVASSSKNVAYEEAGSIESSLAQIASLEGNIAEAFTAHGLDIADVRVPPSRTTGRASNGVPPRKQHRSSLSLGAPRSLTSSPSDRTTEELRRRVLERFLREHAKRTNRCTCCGRSMGTVRHVFNCEIVHSRGRRGARAEPVKLPAGAASGKRGAKGRRGGGLRVGDAGAEDEGSDEEDEAEEEELQNNKQQQKQESAATRSLMPPELKQHLSALLRRDGDLVLLLFPALAAHLFPRPISAASVNEATIEHLLGLFFIENVPVVPTRFRPLRHRSNQKFEHEQTSNYKRILNNVLVLRLLVAEMQRSMEERPDASAAEASTLAAGAGRAESAAVENVPGSTLAEKIRYVWVRLQAFVNSLLDADLDRVTPKRSRFAGVRQLLEKKEGLIRMHMMGKRVDYAARSVISPDINLEVDQVGVPLVFAQKLTYPEPVTERNYTRLWRAVVNGPRVYPGATHIEFEDGSVQLLNPSFKRNRLALANQLLAPMARYAQRRSTAAGDSRTERVGAVSGSLVVGAGVKRVYRHLLDGDLLLMNRQPTLHRPSMQVHRAYVLRGERTLRLHYSACKAYNADFDGDEMNAHFPQTEAARAEALHICALPHQYLVPKDATPLGGLLQDSICSTTLLTLRSRFFTRELYYQLLHISLQNLNKRLLTLPPAIVRPVPLWSGKQLISSILLNLTPARKPPLNLVGKSKVPARLWEGERPKGAPPSKTRDHPTTESDVVVDWGELLSGVIDKAHVGSSAFGLMHCCYELYGGRVLCAMLSAIGRLACAFFQVVGFTLGIEDILLTQQAEESRAKVLSEVDASGVGIATQALELPSSVASAGLSREHERALLGALQMAHLGELARSQHAASGAPVAESEQSLMLRLEIQYKQATNEFQNKVTGVCIPNGLARRFPWNALQLMIVSGAKGTTVNSMQISCLLGQVELEGRRPPMMLTGRRLPSFLAYDLSPRAGGFVSHRFLTGLKPQEFFFHCMAGREGLIDTACKTSSSGYLQRCLVKQLESVAVAYDGTVRDACDEALVQFAYGEDGLDVTRAVALPPPAPLPPASAFAKFAAQQQQEADPSLAVSYKRAAIPQWARLLGDGVSDARLAFLVRNAALLLDNPLRRRLGDPTELQSLLKYRKRLYKWLAKQNYWQSRNEVDDFWKFVRTLLSNQNNVDLRQRPEEIFRQWYSDGKVKQRMKFSDPVTNLFMREQPLWCVSERLDLVVGDYCVRNPQKLLGDPASVPPLVKRESDRRRANTLQQYRRRPLDPAQLQSLVQLKSALALADPGESVGVLAAQSIGEPSTQMTLNTFHFAGRGEMNVTLGIPRMRELLMFGGRHARTPTMECPLRVYNEPECDKRTHKRASDLLFKFSRIHLAKVLERFELSENVRLEHPAGRSVTIRLALLPEEQLKQESGLSSRDVLHFVETRFIHQLVSVTIKRKLFDARRSGGIDHESFATFAAARDEGGAKLAAGEDDAGAGGTENEGAELSKVMRTRRGADAEESGDEDDSAEAADELDSSAQKQRLRQADGALDYVGEEEEQHEIVEDMEDADVIILDEDPSPAAAEKEQGEDEQPADDSTAEATREQEMAAEALAGPAAPSSPDKCDVDNRIQMPLMERALDIRTLLEHELARTVLFSVPGIKRAFLAEEPGLGGTKYSFRTEGVNFEALYLLEEVFDLSRAYSNDVALMCSTYGIEAAYATLIREIRSVFSAYGIQVDYRHLSLIADHMTHSGQVRGFNRNALVDGSTSVVQRMSFETAGRFLRAGVQSAQSESLRNASARLVAGRPPLNGTGAFDLLVSLNN